MPSDTTVTLVPGSQPLDTAYDVALLDLDGVVYTGQGAVPGAVPALKKAREAGMRLAFVTNNASRPPSAIAAHLTRLGVPATSQDVVTSAQAAATLIAGRVPAGSAVLVVGAMGLRLALREKGLRPVSVAQDHPVAVVQGYAPDLSYGLLAEGAIAVRDGALFVASNVDPTLPSPRGVQPGNGSLVRVIANATGVEPVVAGKPEPPLHREAMQRTGAKRPLVVGDRLDTDIEGAHNGGADSLFVLTGVSTARDLVLAPPKLRPTYIAADLAGLQQPPTVVGPLRSQGHLTENKALDLGDWPGSAVRCGAWTATRSGPDAPIELRKEGDGELVDGLRALCALAWSRAQISEENAAPALLTLKSLAGVS
jgi:glycerol 3-phosphatase-2